MENIKLYFDLLNYLLSYRNRSVEELMGIIDRYFKDLSIPFILCLQENKGFERLRHPNLNRFKSEEGLDDDQIILRLAKKEKGYIVSNDKFRQYFDYYDYITQRRIGHSIKEDKLNLFIPKPVPFNILVNDHLITKLEGYA